MLRKISIGLLFNLIAFSAFSIDNQDSTQRAVFPDAYRYKIYSPGQYTGWGFMAAIKGKSRLGGYLSIRFNNNVFKKSNYSFKGTEINDLVYSWKYQEKKIYSRFEWSAGLLGSLYKFQNAEINGFVGAGMLNTRYLYDFIRSGYAQSQHEWVKSNELSGKYLNLEAGILYQFLNSAINFHAGVSGITQKGERMLFMGVGFR